VIPHVCSERAFYYGACMTGIQSLLKSRKVALAVVGVVAVALAEFSGLSTEFQAAIITLFSAVILGIAHEDAGKAPKPQTAPEPEA
jgi:hypothetical protein